MGLISSAYDWLKSFMPRRGKGPGRRLFSAGLYGQGGLGWGTGWHSGDRREQALHYRQWTYIAVRAIANRVAGLSPNVAHVAGPHGPATKTVHVTRKSLGSARVGEQLAHCGDEHPLVRLFASPNPWDTTFDLWFELVMFLELCGIAYLWCPPSEYGLRSGLNTPAELWVVPSHWMWPRYDKDGISHYHCVPVPGGQFFTLPASEIIPLRYKSPVHKIDGWSPLQAGSEWSDAAESIDRSRFHQFKNGAFPLGAVELSEQYTDPTDAELESIYAKFFARLQGEHNYGKPIITPPGVKYTPLNINPAEMAYVESAEQLCTWVLSRHGVPKEIVGLQPIGNDLSWYAPMLQFDKNTLGPKLQYLGQALTQFLCPRYGPGLRIWWDDPAEDNPEARARKIELLMGQGLVTPAEVRSEFGYPPMSPEDEAKYCKLGKPDPPPAPSPVPAIPGVARGLQKSAPYPPDDCVPCRKSAAPLVLKGFTGQITDRRGRKRCYRDGKQVPCGDKGGQGDKEGSRGESKPDKPKKPERPSVQAAVALAVAMKEQGATPQRLADFDTMLGGMTVAQLTELKKALGLKASGKKAELVAKLKERAIASVKKPAPKPEARPEPPAPKPEKAGIDYMHKDPDHPVAKAIASDEKARAVVEAVYKAMGDREEVEADDRAIEEDDAMMKRLYGPESVQGEEREKLTQEYYKKIRPRTREAKRNQEERDEAVRKALAEAMKPEKPLRVMAQHDQGATLSDGFVLREPFRDIPERNKAIDDGLNFVASITEGGTQAVTFAEAPTGRAGYYSTREEVPSPLRFAARLGVTVEVSKDPTIRMGDHDDASTVAHEVGHFIEETKPGVEKKVAAFVEYRLGDEVPIDMGTVPGGEVMKGEMVRKDNFDRAFDGTSAYYVGKVYKNKDTGKIYGTEILSMGIEKLYSDPVRFFAKDPEYAAFVVSVLRM